MKIGEHEVTAVTRNSVKVGCQVVTRAEVEKLLTDMNAQPDKMSLRVSYSPSKNAGDVWLVESQGEILVCMYSKNNGIYNLLKLTPDGIIKYGYCRGTGLPVESDIDTVKVVGTI